MANEISNFPSNISSPAFQAARRELAKRQEQQTEPKIAKPRQAEENYIPANETIATLVRSAIAAIKQGTMFDRGSIVNLVI